MAKSGTVENFSIGYQDYLQAPLQVRGHCLHFIRGQRLERVLFFQPLADNLQSTTYQTFEQDPVKYANYEEATFRALLEWPKTDERMCVLAELYLPRLLIQPSDCCAWRVQGGVHW